MTDQSYRLNSSLSDATFKLSCQTILSKLLPPDQSTLDLVLTHDDPGKAEITLSDGRKFVWFFSMGSLMNPISLYLRNITPIMSYPAKCLDYKMIFRGLNGMADIETCPGSELHGVVHLLSAEQMSSLDETELTYHRILIHSINYQSQSHMVYVYKMKINNNLINLPSERYLDIIIKGCEYYQVQPEYINRLKTEQPVTPRKQLDAFRKFVDIPSDVFYSIEELAQHNGSDPFLPLWVCVNGKILEYRGLPSEDQSDYEIQKRTYTLIKSKFAGREAASVMARSLYEPMYKLSLNDEDLCEEQRAEIEDEIYNRIGNDQNKKYWKAIGHLRK